MNKELIESLMCSVCLELPESEIYQCRNGHTICKNCSMPLRECPECRVPYEQEKIRNRALERILQDITVECEFKCEGCQVLDKRRIVKQHQESCQFRPIKFCEIIGYERCRFSSSDPVSIVNHLKEYHKLRNIASTIQLGNVRASQEDLITNLGFLAHGNEIFLITMITKFQGRTCSLHPIHFGWDDEMSSGIRICFRICDKNGKEAMTWTINPAHFRQAGKSVIDPQLQIATAWLEKNRASEEHLCDFEITISNNNRKAEVTKNNEFQKLREPARLLDERKLQTKAKTNSNSTGSNVFKDLRTPKDAFNFGFFYVRTSKFTPRGEERWVTATSGKCFQNAVKGWEFERKVAYVIRALHKGFEIPGELQHGSNATISFFGQTYCKNEYEILVMNPGTYTWKKREDVSIPNDAIPGGTDPMGATKYIGRVVIGFRYGIGKIIGNYSSCLAPFGATELEYEDFEVLCYA